MSRMITIDGIPFPVPERTRYMRFLRYGLLPERPRKHCKWCGAPAPGKRWKWCSQDCIDQYLIRSRASTVTRRVEDRDHGICALCGLDCEALYRRARQERREGKKTDTVWHQYPDLPKHLCTYWQADHIIPVIEGGGCCGLENYRTLCWRCHKRVTAELARRSARKRRAQQELDLQEGVA